MNADTVNERPPIEVVHRVKGCLPQPLIEHDNYVVRVKLKVNNLLWEELPDSARLLEAEKLACEITELIVGCNSGAADRRKEK